ncbi:hypothetical protein Nepgr_006892 [Nepenthes gracilis]|uniref:Uncharacterized protein n=1 Tax=Nepenthes gracilis TaxID=150966 RepID=A0AAD3XHR6_NEPGR|nr:hypothetical protein Nepgr_006892 [Nepenthes gracilis]
MLVRYPIMHSCPWISLASFPHHHRFSVSIDSGKINYHHRCNIYRRRDILNKEDSRKMLDSGTSCKRSVLSFDRVMAAPLPKHKTLHFGYLP